MPNIPFTTDSQSLVEVLYSEIDFLFIYFYGFSSLDSESHEPFLTNRVEFYLK